MTTQNHLPDYFTPAEREQLLTLWRELRREPTLDFHAGDYRRLRDHVAAAAQRGTWPRDHFGLNPAVRAVQTALIAARETGLKRDGVMACLLAAFLLPDDVPHLQQQFGDAVGKILHGLAHIATLYKMHPVVESENFRNLLVSFAEDLRVILIIIAARANVMRQIRDTENLAMQRKVAEEAAYLYAPLAHKLGLYGIKSELEDLSLKYLEHDAYYHIKEKLNATKKSRDAYITAFITPIEQILREAGLKFHIKGRTKSIHSIWQKMKKQNCPFEGVYDLFAIRIILDSPPEKEKLQCWQAYSLVTDKYRPNPKRLRDWLSIPKSNGYESLHITVLGPENKWVEVQIRTERMDEVAEHGLAAHWRYKGVKGGQGSIDAWLAEMRSALEAGEDMIDQLRNEQPDNEIYVFSPKGDLYKLPGGATVLDFAYAIHTNIGNHCTGAIVGDRNVSMRTALHSGDQVAILTSNNQFPKMAWTDYVVTNRAKAKIRQSVKELEQKDGLIAREQLERTFRNRKIELDQDIMHQTIVKMGYKEISLFFKDLADGRLDMEDYIKAYQLNHKRAEGLLERTESRSAGDFNLMMPAQQAAQSDDVLIIDRNLKGIDYTLAKCCNPIFGDEVFGFVTRESGIKIHRQCCPNAAKLKERFPYRIVRAQWSGAENRSGAYTVTLRIVGNDDLGVVNNISSIISKDEKMNMRSFSIDTHDGLFTASVTLQLQDTSMLERLLRKLRTVKGVKAAERAQIQPK